MRYPITVLTRQSDFADRAAMLLTVRRFVSLRTEVMLSGFASQWQFFGNRSPLPSVESLLELAIERLGGRALQQGGAKLQLWFGDPPAQSFEHEAILAAAISPLMTDSPRLMEQWTLHLHQDRMSLLELSLVSATPEAAPFPAGESWMSRHLAFCRNVLYDELFDCVWNQFATAPELANRDTSQQASEYWGLEPFLAEAVRSRILLTDARTIGRKAAWKRQNTSEIPPAPNIGRSKGGWGIVALTDSKAAFNAFEERMTQTGQS